MRLTRRQEAFIRGLIDLYRQASAPVHYTEVAERLGVSPFTAYDMLRLLERKGLVTSEYHLDASKASSGRSGVYFKPTGLVDRWIAEIAQGSPAEDPAELSDRAMERIREGVPQEEQLLEDILRRFDLLEEQVPPDLSNLIRVVSPILWSLRKRPGVRLLARSLNRLVEGHAQDMRPVLLEFSGFLLGFVSNEPRLSQGTTDELAQLFARSTDLVLGLDLPLAGRLVRALDELLTRMVSMPS